MKKKNSIHWVLTAAAILALAGSVNAAPVIAATGAVASTSFGGATATQVINTSRLNGSNQLIVGNWSNNWLFNAQAGQISTFTSEQWIYIDLGRNYDLDEIRIWNYFDNDATDWSGRGLKDFDLYIAGDGATLPVGGVAAQSPFTGEGGWSYLLGSFDDPPKILTKAPRATVPIGPTDTFVVTGTSKVRYIGIDVGTNTWLLPEQGSGGGSIGGLAQIQVTGTLTPAILTATTAVASTSFDAAVATNVINAAKLNTSNQLMVGDWGSNWLFDATSGENSFTSFQWIYIDLGQNCDLGQIRIWNYFDNNLDDVSGRGLKDFDLYVAGDGAILPAGGTTPPGGGMQSPFTGENGWSYLLGAFDDPVKVLTKAPLATVPISPTDTFVVTGTNNVRYIGIDVGANLWDGSGGGSIGGLAQIQITAAPMTITSEPNSLTVATGDTAVFTVNGVGIVGYQWKKNGTNVFDGSTGSGATISGATTNELTIMNVQLADEGNYTCEIADVSSYKITTASAQLLIKRLIAYWPLNNSLVETVGSRNGSAASPTYTTGIIGSGALSNTLVTVPNSSSYFNFYTRGFTSTFWVKADVGTVSQAVVSKLDWSNSKGFHNFVPGSNTNFVTVMEGNPIEAVGPVVPGQWNFIATTYDAQTATLKLYVNRLLYARWNFAFGSKGGSNADVSFGGGYPYSFNGATDDIKIYSYALSGVELAQAYVNGTRSSACFCSDWDIKGGSPVGGDCKVNFADFSEFAMTYWLADDDLNDGSVEFEEFVADWLKNAITVVPQ